MGIRTTHLDLSAIVDELIGNHNGSTVRVSLLWLLASLTALQGPSYATLAELSADLDWPDGAQGYVTDDEDPGADGRYRKDGASGTGSWTRIGDIPSGGPYAAELAAKAPLFSPDFGGTPTVPLAAPGTATPQIASTAFVAAAVATAVSAAIAALVESAPGALDTLNELAAAIADDPNFAATMTTQLALKAPLDGANLTNATAPTAAPGTNTTALANTAFVHAAITSLIAAAPGALDTLNELAAAIADDPNFAATMTTQLALKAPLDGANLTNATAPTAAPGTNTTALANTAFVHAAITSLIAAAPGALDTLNELAAAIADDPNFAATMVAQLALKAPLDSPDFAGVPRVDTAAPGTSTRQIASTAFVAAASALLSAALADARAVDAVIRLELEDMSGTGNAAIGTVRAGQAAIPIANGTRMQVCWPETNTAAEPTLTVAGLEYALVTRDLVALQPSDLIGLHRYDFVQISAAPRVAMLMGSLHRSEVWESELAIGYVAPDLPLALSADRDTAGRLVALRFADGTEARIDAMGLWWHEGVAPGLHAGWLTGGADPAAEVLIDSAGRPVSATTLSGEVSRIDARGLWADRGATSELAVGWVTGDIDAALAEATLDRDGRLVRGLGATGAVGAEIVALPGGYARRDIETRGGQIDLVFSAQMPVPAARIAGPFGPLLVGGGFLASAACATEAVTGEAVSLTYATTRRLAYHYVRSVVVTRVSDSVVLTEGTHYRLDADTGTLEGLINVAAYDVTVNYTGHHARVEYLSAHRTSGALTLTAGPEKKRWFSEYEPVQPSGDVLLWRAIRTPEGAALVPSWRSDGPAQRARPALDRSRRLLEGLRARLAAGAPLVLYGYGDSITQCGSASPYTIDDLNLAPDGPRDRINHFEFWDLATAALIPTEDLGDGRGNTRIKESWNWRLKAHLEAVYGATVTYRNYGIGGSTSAATVAGNGLMNGLHPTRLGVVTDDIEAAVAGGSAALVILAFGMNSGVDHYGNTRSIVQALTGAGATVVVMSPVRPNPRFAGVTQDDWRLTSAHLERAAYDEGVPFADCRLIFEDEALGRSRAELCGATLNNHPDRGEYRASAALLTELF